MNGRNAPLSPVSLGDSDWPSAYPMDKDDPYTSSRGQLISPPNSGGSISGGPNMNGFPPGLRTGGGPSPPPSVGRSSTATNLYNRRESGRSQRDDNTEIQLAEHYVALKRFLSQTSRDGKPAPPANKARDKLQRLTSVQFLELSTDVFDELVRRQAYSRRPPNAPPSVGPPAYLLPEETFHPKRNQARQKLASLGPPRFRDLATDVFCELERRFPHFSAGDIPRMGSPSSMRGPSRTGTPVNGFPPRGQNRRRPSEAGSIRSMRSGLGPGPGPLGGGMGSVPPSPGLPPNGYDRPMQKQSQINTIVPNKSTMVEEDDDAADAVVNPLSLGAKANSSNGSNGSNDFNGLGNGGDSEKRAQEAEDRKKLIDDYESQIDELRNKMEAMEQKMQRQQEQLDAAQDDERSRASAANAEKQESGDLRRDLENRLAYAQDLSESLQQDMDRMRSTHDSEERQLRAQIDELQQSLAESAQQTSRGGGNEDLLRENEELRQAVQEQQQVAAEVRSEAEQFLREMRVLSQQSGSNWEKQEKMEKTIQSLESEVDEWRNRYARAKTQLRSMRVSSMGLPMEEDAGKYVRDRGFMAPDGLVKDVHVTKFQIAVDDLLRQVRAEGPEKAMEAMKVVVVSVRRMTKGIEASGRQDEQVGKLKVRMSMAANNLITATKNYATSAGLTPVSLLDAAASNLAAAVVELLRTAKIRETPANELEEDDDDDGTMTPVDTSGYYSPPQSNGVQVTQAAVSAASAEQEGLQRPPPFQGLRGLRSSVDSSAYSPINSPRQSNGQYDGGASNGMKGNGVGNGNYTGMNRNLPSNGYGRMVGGADQRTEELKAFLDDQTATMVQTIQNMVGAIRGDAPVDQITGQINEIIDIVGRVIAETEASGQGGPSLDKLMSCRQRLVEAGDRGAAMGRNAGGPVDWRSWTTSLPPIAFEIARETKELVKRIDRLVLGDGGDDFS